MIGLNKVCIYVCMYEECIWRRSRSEKSIRRRYGWQDGDAAFCRNPLTTRSLYYKLQKFGTAQPESADSSVVTTKTPWEPGRVKTTKNCVYTLNTVAADNVDHKACQCKLVFRLDVCLSIQLRHLTFSHHVTNAFIVWQRRSATAIFIK